MSILENRYVVTQKSALDTFTVEQREVLIRYEKVFNTLGLTAFTKIEQILKKLGVDIKEYPPEIFVNFPNRYQTIGEKQLYQFDRTDYRTLLGISSLYWFLSTLEKEIHFFLSDGNWKLQMVLPYASFEEKEEILDKLYEMFFSGKVAYVYLLDIETAFPQKRSLNFVTTAKKFLKNKPIYLSDMYLDRDEVETSLEKNFVVEVDDYADDTTCWLEEVTIYSVVKTELDLQMILEKLGFKTPFTIWDVKEHVLELEDSKGKSFRIKAWGNLFFIKLSEETSWCTFKISTPGISISMKLLEPIIGYL